MPLDQRLKGGQIAPLDGVDQVVVVGDDLGQTAAGDGVQHPETAVIGVGILKRPPEIHLVHRGKPCFVEQAVGLVELVEIGRFGVRQRIVSLGPLADLCPLFRGAAGRKIPQDLRFHRRPLVDQLVHDVTVQPGDGRSLVGHDLHQPVLLQTLQDHPDHGARRTEPGAKRIFAQQCTGAQRQINDLPLQHRIDLCIGFVLILHKVALFAKGSPTRKDSPGRGRWHTSARRGTAVCNADGEVVSVHTSRLLCTTSPSSLARCHLS